MKLRLLPLLLLLPTILPAANREMVELQRDVAALQDQVRTLQRTLDEKLTQLQTIVQQTLDTSSKSNTSVAVLDSTIRERLAEQQKTMGAPVANMTAKMDQMSSDFSGLRESVADMSDRMNKLQLQITELSNTVRTMGAPAAPPPTAGVAPGVGVPPTAGAATPPAGMSPKQIYETAMRDRSGGNLDLAQQGFTEYLRYFGATELAPNAQFYLGQIAYDKGDYPTAIRNFDTVLEKYTDNNKTPDAIFMKGMSLLKAGQRDAAAKEFLNVSTKYPNSEVAAKAKAQRKALGLSTPTAAAPVRPAPRRRR